MRAGAAGVVGRVPSEAQPLSWTPASLGSDVILWMPRDPASITITGSGVSAWADASGSETSWVQTTDGNRPAYTAEDADFGGRHSLSFNGTSQRLALAISGSLSDASQSHACYMLVKSATTAAGNRTIHDTSQNGGGGGDIRFGFYWTATSNGGKHGVWTGGLANDVTASTPDTAAQVIGWEADADNSLITVYENGVSVGTAAYSAKRALNSSHAGSLGCAYNATQFFSGKIGEIVRCNRALTADERAALVAYLGAGVL